MRSSKGTVIVVAVSGAVLLFAGIWIAYSGPSLVTEGDLPSMILQENEAPKGMQFVDSESGPLTASDLTTNEAQLADLERDGFVAAHDSVFASPGMAGVPGEIIGNEPGVVDSAVFVFDSVEGSQANFERLRTDLPSSFGSSNTLFPISVEDLGDESLALRVEFSNAANGPDVAVLYLWRVENAILRLVRWGEVLNEADDVRPLVDLMNSHLTH